MFGNKQTNASNNVLFYTEKVNKAGINSSLTEKKAETLERNCVDLKKVEYMSDFIGKTFIGIISSITEFGIYIMLDNTVEGLVKYKEMHDDYYIVDTLKGTVKGEKNKKSYKIGDRVVVRLMDTNIEKRVVEFRLLRKE
jgi:ribonuclease R